jgi:hypothetical protein
LSIKTARAMALILLCHGKVISIGVSYENIYYFLIKRKIKDTEEMTG